MRRRITSAALSAVLVAAALLVAAPPAEAAQTYSGNLTLATFNRVTTYCSSFAKRTYNVFNFNFNVSSSTTFTFTVTRTSGTGLGVDLYQNGFDPTQPCTNYWGSPGATTSSTNTATVTLTLPYSSQFALVVSGNSATDTGGFNITVTSSNGTTVTPVCTSSILSPASFSNVPAAGGAYQTTYSPSLGCGAWTSNAANTPWISGIPSNGSGSAVINFNVAANSGGARNANITIGSKTLSVSQAAASCSYSLAQSSASVAASGGPQTLGLSTNISNCAWTASSNASWITGVTASGTGSGTVNYTVAANTGPARSGTITAGGKTFTVNQASGCTVSLPVGSSTVGVAGGSSSFNVTTGSGCQYTASSGASWLSNFASTATGVSFDVAANSGVARSATIDVACNDTSSKAAYTLNQDGAIAQPAITQQPADQTVVVGDPIVLSVNATGGGLAYQWQKGGSDITGATSSTYVVAHAALADAGDYAVVVSNLAGSVTSGTAHVTVNAAPADAGSDAASSDAGSDAASSDAGGDAATADASGDAAADAGSDAAINTDAGAPDAASNDAATGNDAAVGSDAAINSDAGDAGSPPGRTSASGSGCSCTVAGGSSSSTAPFLGAGLMLLGLGLVVRRRRRR